jgi:hypothetical protein
MPAFFAEKPLFLACMPITDYFAAATIWTGRLFVLYSGAVPGTGEQGVFCFKRKAL